MKEPVISNRLYLQTLGDHKEHIVEFLRVCLEDSSYRRLLINLQHNPFIIFSFYWLVPQLFFDKEEDKEEEDEIKSGIQALIARNKKKAQENGAKPEETSFEEYVINFISKTEQDYTIVDKITYTYMKTISRNLHAIHEKDEKAKNKKTVVDKAVKLGG